MGLLKIERDHLTLDGAPFYLASGDMHYFRFFPGGWKRRLLLMKDFGLTAVQTYVPWNAHEPRPGQYDFSGCLDLAAFLRECDELGLKVLLRPSPYMCSEWDLGGLPSWLLKNPHIALRSSDPDFIEPMTRYLTRLCREFVPYLSTNGGPIIAVAIENEYGSYGNDMDYLRIQMELMRSLGVDVPFYATDGDSPFMLKNGACDPSVWQAVNYRIESLTSIARLRAHQPDKPPLVGEYWAGRSMHWEDEFHHREAEPVATAYRQALDLGAYVSFYMFVGGTNFGFMHGANYGKLGVDGPEDRPRYISGMTSYDVDALISEHGVPTEKYYACRRELDAFLGKPARKIDPPLYEAQAPAPVMLKNAFSLFDNLDVLSEKTVQRAQPIHMEALDQDYGFILYSTFLRHTDDRTCRLLIDGLADRALVYVDGTYRGVIMREQEGEPVRFHIAPEGSRLDILVENMGRVNFGRHLADRKGINGGVTLGYENESGNVWFPESFIMNWQIHTLPLRDLSSLHEGPGRVDSPMFYCGTFRAKPGIDSFIDMKNWNKGNVFVNGFNLGRYWNHGPQQALYLPGELLKSENDICILELHPNHEPLLSFRDTPSLVGNLTDKPVHCYVPETAPALP